MNNAITREQYLRILDRKLNHKYEKNSGSIYGEIKGLQSVAIKNAQRLLDQYDSNAPARNDPSTTVHLLVEQLMEFSRTFGSKNP